MHSAHMGDEGEIVGIAHLLAGEVDTAGAGEFLPKAGCVFPTSFLNSLAKRNPKTGKVGALFVCQFAFSGESFDGAGRVG